ncbi:SMC-Scp complex subunit ScpB [Pediococcus damnosus]|uniref:SMC-Scp complex subunit ScpB n=1 Tax=Pediococcus damnosus TaxID=51663 RepID=UPI00061F1506|nr:SMC-Scp complex subunit ScpB [Pediococcus damnosus]KJU74689.1 segregation and condensation protein B [Pediococcus damnosus LMG 28219]PIO82100.1 SMC-Scp complex subunit ScpB [Pediococcus damnosus]PIO86185.1 SMC-Scp complex subunit ScpB [Pediococcus damnosus]PJE50230.1 SMC-Scp complex subunit ScpB [Pediococcus damnosus]
MSNIEKIEALLFVSGEDGLSLSDLSEMTGFMRPAVSTMLEKLAKKYKEDSDSALTLLHFGNNFRLATKPETSDVIKNYFDAPQLTKLSPASLEVLAIVAYKQPITRLEIDDIRGVQSGTILQKLTIRNLIKEAGRLDEPGRPILYATTDYFLDYFGLNAIDQLPALPNIQPDNSSDTKDLYLKQFNEKLHENEDDKNGK